MLTATGNDALIYDKCKYSDMWYSDFNVHFKILHLLITNNDSAARQPNVRGEYLSHICHY